MLGSRTVVVAFALLLALAAPAAANNPPAVTNATVSPTSLGSSGGNVTVTGHVTDDSNAIDIVFIEVRGPVFFSTAMTRGGITPDDFAGGVQLPPNFTPNPVSWQIYVRALDLE